MAVGQKLGKILSGVGAGLSFVPGPWSAIGVALTVGGQVASQVGQAKDRREAEREREQQTNQPEPAQPLQDSARPHSARPHGTQIEEDPLNPQMQPASRNTFQPTQPSLGNYADQLDSSIAQMLVNSNGGLYG